MTTRILTTDLSRTAPAKRSPFAYLATLLRVRRERRALSKLSDALLSDIGYSREAARAEAARRAWDAPRRFSL
ncbi:DUF1127 domain-containing protein [Pseudooceanicola sp. CBS1P-1]|uniref:DUF1127 domain-containing protein n=1 Tax=Pseudooceanicola albus TaxID=2692189 RepID=A0A6L7G4Q0_9RHOB|nr:MULTISPECIES: DUF1127 domain-containing protein [Pseudooceanicola]MBT9384695.1 DUF1127 domain-containing protein [Pseudooceanicola endophyticus]MXN18396.1 DUF1127 domain-containing protein [Pseudooceanicola albus]